MWVEVLRSSNVYDSNSFLTMQNQIKSIIILYLYDLDILAWSRHKRRFF